MRSLGPARWRPLAAVVVALVLLAQLAAAPALGAPLPGDGDDAALVRLGRGRGAVRFAYHPASAATEGVLWLSGTDGGLDGPFDGLYSGLARELQGNGVASAQLIYHRPGQFEPSLVEAREVLDYLERAGLAHVAVVGFSFGGGVAVELAAERTEIEGVIVLSGQGFGTEEVNRLAPRPLYILHTLGDSNIPVATAYSLFERAGAPAALVVLSRGDHHLETVAPEVERLVRRWLGAALPPPAGGGSPSPASAE